MEVASLINITKEELLARIEKLEERVDLLMRKPRGPIGMTEYRHACERKDKAVMRAYLEQENERARRER
jgi:hypothetical protein